MGILKQLHTSYWIYMQEVQRHINDHITPFLKKKTECAWSRDQMTSTSHHMTSKNRMRHLIKNKLCANCISHYLQISTKITTFFLDLHLLEVHCLFFSAVWNIDNVDIWRSDKIQKSCEMFSFNYLILIVTTSIYWTSFKLCS